MSTISAPRLASAASRFVERGPHGWLGPAIEEASETAKPGRLSSGASRRLRLHSTRSRSSHRLEHESQVVDRASDRTDVIQARRERKDTAESWTHADLVGFIPATPQNDAGRVIEPPVWVPIAPKHIPQATAAAEPLDEPPGVRSRFQGFRVTGGSIQA